MNLSLSPSFCVSPTSSSTCTSSSPNKWTSPWYLKPTLQRSTGLRPRLSRAIASSRLLHILVPTLVLSRTLAHLASHPLHVPISFAELRRPLCTPPPPLHAHMPISLALIAHHCLSCTLVHPSTPRCMCPSPLCHLPALVARTVSPTHASSSLHLPDPATPPLHTTRAPCAVSPSQHPSCAVSRILPPSRCTSASMRTCLSPSRHVVHDHEPHHPLVTWVREHVHTPALSCPPSFNPPVAQACKHACP
jgi:hypothetical protein